MYRIVSYRIVSYHYIIYHVSRVTCHVSCIVYRVYMIHDTWYFILHTSYHKFTYRGTFCMPHSKSKCEHLLQPWNTFTRLPK